MNTMSLQLKLNLIITLLLLFMLVLSAIFIVDNAREDVRAELSSTSNLALHLLDTEISHYTSDFGWLNNSMKQESRFFGLTRLSNIRHLKIEFYDNVGRLRDSNKSAATKTTTEAPPKWFGELMGASDFDSQSVHRNIIINSRLIGQLVVTPDPSYEVAEVWNDTVDLLGLVFAFFIVINLMVYWAVRYTFKPVSKIVSALTQVEEGDYSARLPVFKPVELQAIGAKFNTMADRLALSVRNNHDLTQQIIRLQEDERKGLARDIHDEIGQYLTAIHVDATAIKNAKQLSQAQASALAIGDVTKQMMDMVHELLERLRPRVLDELGTAQALGELIHHWRQRHRQVSVVHKISPDIGEIDESVAITAYRVMQECLTNIAKHAQAKQVDIAVTQSETELSLTIQDDGQGFDPEQMTKGYGLAGMKERVQGLSGKMQIRSNQNIETSIDIVLPKQLDVKQATLTEK